MLEQILFDLMLFKPLSCCVPFYFSTIIENNSSTNLFSQQSSHGIIDVDGSDDCDDDKNDDDIKLRFVEY